MNEKKSYACVCSNSNTDLRRIWIIVGSLQKLNKNIKTKKKKLNFLKIDRVGKTFSPSLSLQGSRTLKLRNSELYHHFLRIKCASLGAEDVNQHLKFTVVDLSDYSNRYQCRGPASF